MLVSNLKKKKIKYGYFFIDQYQSSLNQYQLFLKYYLFSMDKLYTKIFTERYIYTTNAVKFHEKKLK